MKVYKDNEHSVSLSPFSLRGKRYLMVSVGLYAAFDPEAEEPRSRLRTEQDFWKEAPDVFAALGKPPVPDFCLPKPGAEVLVAGFCRTPDKVPARAQEVAFQVGTLHRRFAVFGDRLRLPGGGMTEPAPFTAMPLNWAGAFGGPDFPANPEGKGLLAENKASDHLPNVEDLSHLISGSDDRPRPACPLMIDIANMERRALSGTYDQNWLDTRWPAYPDDLNPDFFYSAQPEQRLASVAAGPLFFRGDESIEIAGMHHEYPHLRSRLPGKRIRAFVTVTKEFKPFADAPARGAVANPSGAKPPLPYAKDLEQPGVFGEVDLRIDTVWLLPDLAAAFVLYRGLLPVVDDEMDDILRVYVVTENLEDAPQSLEYYLEEQKKRIKPVVEIDVAPFAEAQAKTTKVVKMARDLPKIFEKVKKSFLDQQPLMPLSLGDMAHSAHKTLSTARSTLDMLEKQMLEQRAMFSHLVSFDLSIFPRMRGMVDEQEKNLEKLLKKGEAVLTQGNTQVVKAKVRMTDQWQKTQSMLPQGAPALPDLDAMLAKLDSASPENMLCQPPSLNPWHDRGFPLVIAARRALRRDERMLACLTALGFEEKTLEDAWLGHNPEPVTDTPEHWGLPPGPAFTLPAGLYVPRFSGKVLTGLKVYPATEEAGLDPAAAVAAPESDVSPLSLPASYPGGAVCVVPDDVSALFAEQEAGDFCHIVAAAEPAALAAVKDLPPLLPPLLPEEEGTAVPLVVLLPGGTQGRRLLEAWQSAYPAVIPVFLPEGASHVLHLAGLGTRLRRLLLDALPQETAAMHDFDVPLPPKDKPMEAFTLNLPLPDEKEISGRVTQLIAEIRSHFPTPEAAFAEEMAKHSAMILEMAKNPLIPAEVADKLTALCTMPFAELAAGAPPPQGVMENLRGSMLQLEAAEKHIAESSPEAAAASKDAFARAKKRFASGNKKFAELEAFGEEGEKKLAAAKEMFAKGDLPDDVKAAFAAQGVDPNALRKPTREEVQELLAAGKSLSHRNLCGMDLSGLDFSGADLSHALCSKTVFTNCRFVKTDFAFTIANEADFSGSVLHEAFFKQSILQKAVLRDTDCTASHWELVTLQETDCSNAVFDRAEIKLSTWDKAVLRGARFEEARLSLSSLGETDASGADFRRLRCYKCIFRQTPLHGASFQGATLTESLLQGCAGPGISFAGADLRKFYLDMDSDFSGADFSGADMRECSLRMSRLNDARFSGVQLEGSMIVHCELQRAHLAGLRGSGCRFIKCDLTDANLRGANLLGGSLRKCRLVGADLSQASLYAAELRNLVIGETRFEGANLRRTPLQGKLEGLRQ